MCSKYNLYNRKINKIFKNMCKMQIIFISFRKCFYFIIANNKYICCNNMQEKQIIITEIDYN